MVEFAAQHPIAAVGAVDDQVTEVAAVICQFLGLRNHSIESTVAARNKDHMRELLHAAGVPQPRFRLCCQDDDPVRLAGQVNYPCVLKPLSLSGSQGVIRADNSMEFVQAAQRLASILQDAGGVRGAERGGAERPRQFLVEDFIPGQEVALEGLLSRGQLRVLALFDKPDPLDGPFFEETIYVTPSRLPAKIQGEIAECAARACQALGLTDGPVHAELRVNIDSTGQLDGLWVIEVNPRSIGGHCSRMLRFGTGLSLEELIIRHALDEDFDPPARQAQPAGVMMIPIPRAGLLTEVCGLDEAQAVSHIEQVSITVPLGQQLVPLPEGSRYLGFIFSRAATAEAVEAALRAAHSRLDFVIRPRVDRGMSEGADTG